MKDGKPLTLDPKPAKAGRGAHKALRVMRRKAYYGAQPARTMANKKRAIARHLRMYPEDMFAREVFVKAYGKGSDVGPKTVPLARAVKRAKRRAKLAKVRA